jgi:hypothetical protein
MHDDPTDDDLRVVPALYFTLAGVAALASISIALNLGRSVERPIEWHLDWRRKAGQRVRWLQPPDVDEAKMRRAILVVRIGWAAGMLLFAAVFVAAGIHSLA